MIKRIVISVGVVVIIAGITVGALLLFRRPESAPVAQTPVSKKLVFDHSKDYGACTLLSVSTIKTALGDAAANLQASVDVGITSDRYFGNGVKDVVSDSQTCVYAFAPGGSTDTALSASNGLTIKRTKYTNTDGPKAVIAQMKQDPTATIISSLGDAAFYTADTSANGPNATSSFTLLVFKDNESTSYSIIQPTAASTFTTDSAKTALLALTK